MRQAQPSFSVARRRLLAAAVLGGFAHHALGQSALPTATDLQEQLAAALRQSLPLLVMVSLPGCPFCKVARDNYLLPMLRERAFAAVQVDMQSATVLADFDGAQTTHAQQVRSWGVRFAPSLLFFGRGGVEVAQRLSGGTQSDFYGAYLDQRLGDARTAVRRAG